MKEVLFSYSRGAQFRGGKTAYLFLFLLLEFLFEGVFLAHGHLLIAAVLVPFIVMAFFYVFDFRGVQINNEATSIREYHLSILGRRGAWLDFSAYRSLFLDYESFSVSVTDLSDGGFNGHGV